MSMSLRRQPPPGWVASTPARWRGRACGRRREEHTAGSPSHTTCCWAQCFQKCCYLKKLTLQNISNQKGHLLFKAKDEHFMRRGPRLYFVTEDTVCRDLITVSFPLLPLSGAYSFGIIQIKNPNSVKIHLSLSHNQLFTSLIDGLLSGSCCKGFF